MSMSAFQKVTLVSCLVLCVSLLLPKMLVSTGKKEAGQQEGPGRFPPTMHRQKMSIPKSHNAEAVAMAKGGSGGGTGGGRTSFMAQIIPVYGFGILLYILYILFKITSKGTNAKLDQRFPALNTRNTKTKITNYELAKLQEKLKETEEVMKTIVSKVEHNPDRIKSVTSEHNEKLLRQLKEITRAMQEGKLIEEISPKKEAEEGPYMEDWEGYPEETFPIYDELACCRHKYDTIVVDHFNLDQPTAEELAERVGEIETMAQEEDTAGQDIDGKRWKQTSFCEQEDLSHYNEDEEQEDYGECEEEDPAVIAENIGFTCYSFSDEEELCRDLSGAEDTADKTHKETETAREEPFGMIRKRNRKGTQ
ncbi:protein RIC-3-like isoform X2 [Polyodon spathula]|uniref:protein RIC-3-like isoform X2 n=1 Tax=Polyodon spathula TaxID=7913 RepID=UPI001B7E1DD8|nr:protein RIC-3-like isoform X2 [Polyodon spathula]